MNNVQNTPQIYWVGGNDRRIERFENMFSFPNGVAYNYLITDEKTAYQTLSILLVGYILRILPCVLGNIDPLFLRLITVHIEELLDLQMLK